MQTIIGGTGTWTGGGGSGSNIGHISTSYSNPSTFNGGHTNFDFAGQSADDTLFFANTTAHEDGHSFGLVHQSAYVSSSNVTEYDPGDPAGPTNGYSSVSPLMGGYQGTRVNWRVGTTDTGAIRMTSV
jgi:hypothetical protein